MAARLATLVLALVAVQHAAPAAAQTAAQPIRYTLSFPAPQTHYVEVAAVVPTSGRPDVELMMAVWTPGSYLVREYERNVEGVSATAAEGRSLAVTKSDKNRWRVTTGGAATVNVKYRVYSREMTVRNNWVDAGFAMLNGPGAGGGSGGGIWPRWPRLIPTIAIHGLRSSAPQTASASRLCE